MDYTNRFLSLVMGCLLASGAGNAATGDIPQLNIHLNGNGNLVYEVEYAGKETVRVKLNLANVLNADLVINGTIQTVEADSGQTSLSNRASEVTALLLSHYPPEIVRSITTIGLRVIYNSDSGEQRNLDMLVLDDKDQRHKNSRIQVLKNTIWWWQYLRMAARQARRTQAMIDGATDETM